jgi:hypothetical protein
LDTKGLIVRRILLLWKARTLKWLSGYTEYVIYSIGSQVFDESKMFEAYKCSYS